jgi:hypothetical protein
MGGCRIGLADHGDGLWNRRAAVNYGGRDGWLVGECQRRWWSSSFRGRAGRVWGICICGGCWVRRKRGGHYAERRVGGQRQDTSCVWICRLRAVLRIKVESRDKLKDSSVRLAEI